MSETENTSADDEIIKIYNQADIAIDNKFKFDHEGYTPVLVYFGLSQYLEAPRSSLLALDSVINGWSTKNTPDNKNHIVLLDKVKLEGEEESKKIHVAVYVRSDVPFWIMNLVSQYAFVYGQFAANDTFVAITDEMQFDGWAQHADPQHLLAYAQDLILMPPNNATWDMVKDKFSEFPGGFDVGEEACDVFFKIVGINDEEVILEPAYNLIYIFRCRLRVTLKDIKEAVSKQSCIIFSNQKYLANMTGE